MSTNVIAIRQCPRAEHPFGKYGRRLKNAAWLRKMTAIVMMPNASRNIGLAFSVALMKSTDAITTMAQRVIAAAARASSRLTPSCGPFLQYSQVDKLHIGRKDAERVIAIARRKFVGGE